jgi:hypothetical protein
LNPPPKRRPRSAAPISLLAALLAGVSLALAGSGCHKSAAPKPHVVPPLPAVAIADVPAPAMPSTRLEKGMVLGTIAKDAYGHGKFSGFLAVYNHIADPTKLKIGAEIRTPSLAQAFVDEGMDPKYQPAINVLAKTVHDFYALLPAYQAEKQKQVKSTNQTKIALSPDMKAKLEALANNVEAANAVFGSAAPPHKVPQATMGQFKQAMEELRSLANGKIWEYDTEMVGQRFGAGMTDALLWTQQRHQ